MNLRGGKKMDEEDRKFQIMNFIYNALENGWEVKKRDSATYVFRKKHRGDRKVFMENYLETFLGANLKNSWGGWDERQDRPGGERGPGKEGAGKGKLPCFYIQASMGNQRQKEREKERQGPKESILSAKDPPKVKDPYDFLDQNENQRKTFFSFFFLGINSSISIFFSLAIV